MKLRTAALLIALGLFQAVLTPAYATVSSETRTAGPYTGNGVTTSFAFTFKVFAKTDLVVTHQTGGVETVKTVDVHYSVSLNANQDSNPGGTITYPISGSPLSASETLTIDSAVPRTQGVDLLTGGPFLPNVIENALDRNLIISQQLKRDLDRSIKQPRSDSVAIGDLPTAANRANTFLGFDADGALTTLSSIDDLATLTGSQTLTNKTLTLPQVNDTSSDHQYIFGVNELSADRTVTLPPLTGSDTFVFNDFAATLTNKTIALGSNTVSGTKAQFNTAVTDDDFAYLAATQTFTAAQGFSVGTDTNPGIFWAGDTNTGIRGGADDTLRFITAGTERVRVHSTGPLLVGHVAPLQIGSGFTPLVQAHETDDAVFGGTIWTNTASLGASAHLGRSRGSLGTHTVLQSGDALGTVSLFGSDGTDFALGARIYGEVDGTPGNNDMPARLIFGTSADGAQGGTERLRIDSKGNIIVNTAAIATNATDGFLYVPTMAGTPTGVPTTYAGRAPIVIDTTNNKLYFYSGGAWRDAGP